MKLIAILALGVVVAGCGGCPSQKAWYQYADVVESQLDMLRRECANQRVRLDRLAADSARCAEAVKFTAPHEGTIESVYVRGQWFCPCDTTRKGE